jgi:hypothetical protein
LATSAAITAIAARTAITIAASSTFAASSSETRLFDSCAAIGAKCRYGTGQNVKEASSVVHCYLLADWISLEEVF